MAWNNQQSRLLALFIIMMILPTIAVGIRLWAVLVSKTRHFWWDDVFATAALLFIYGTESMFIWWVSLGFGRHAAEVPPDDYAKSSLILFTGAFVFDVAICLPKYSVLFFYKRVFEDTSIRFSVALWVVGALNTGWLISALLSTGFQCSPRAAAWDALVQGKCFPQWPWFLGTAVSSTIIDLCILLMPLPLLWKLQMPKTRRFSVIMIFVLAYSVVICSIGRIATLGALGDSYKSDITYLGISYVSWVASEAPVSVISVSIPIIVQYGKRIWEHGWQYVYTGKEAPKGSRKRRGTNRHINLSDLSLSTKLRFKLRGFRSIEAHNAATSSTYDNGNGTSLTSYHHHTDEQSHAYGEQV